MTRGRKKKQEVKPIAEPMVIIERELDDDELKTMALSGDPAALQALIDKATNQNKSDENIPSVNSKILQLQKDREERAQAAQGRSGRRKTGNKPAKFVPFDTTKKRVNKFETDKRFKNLHKLHLDEVAIHKNTVGVPRERESVQFYEVECIYCRNKFTVSSNYPIPEDMGYCCNQCGGAPKR